MASVFIDSINSIPGMKRSFWHLKKSYIYINRRTQLARVPLSDILKKDPVLMQHIAKKRLIFLEANFDIQIDKDLYSKSLIPAFEKHKNIIEHLLQKA